MYHCVTVITMCFMFHQRLPRCLQQSTKKGKPTSSYSLHLATSANVIYDVGVSTFSLVLLLINVLHRYLIVYWQEDKNTLKQVVQSVLSLWAILFSTQEYNRGYLYMRTNCFHGNRSKICPTDSDFFGLSRSTRQFLFFFKFKLSNLSLLYIFSGLNYNSKE